MTYKNLRKTALAPWFLAYSIPVVAFLLAGFQFVHALLAPLAGPFTARALGHTCGLSSLMPRTTAATTLFGSLLLLAWLRWRNRWLLVPLSLCWFAWIAGGFISMINVYE